MMESATDWRRELSDYQDVELGPPASEDLIVRAEASIGPLPEASSRGFLLQSNGLVCRSFCMYPVFDPARREAWESIQRANDPGATRALAADAELLKRFLVFADIGDGFSAIDRSDGTIWFEEGGGESFDQVDLAFREFIKVMITNAL